jgi:hypothetical protein
MTDKKYDLYWGEITFKNGNIEAIVATSEEAYYAYEKYHEGSTVSMPNYGYLDSIKDFDDEMLSEVNYDAEAEAEKEALLQKILAQRKVMNNMTSEEKVSYLLESFDL